MSTFNMIVCQEFGYSETELEFINCDADEILENLDHKIFYKYADNNECLSLQSAFKFHDFDESDMNYPIYGNLDPMIDDADYRLIIERNN